jgi:hypothetical protein
MQMHIVKIVGLVVVAAIAIVLVMAALRPDTFRVARTADIKAPPEKIYAHVIDFKAWGAWSPYEKLDPAMNRTYGGAERGTGATYAWASNSAAGEGNMKITDALEPSKIALDLNFTKPFEAHNNVTFTFVPKGDDVTQVTWAMEGGTPYMAKIMHVFFNMDKMVGSDFETGLANLKKISEQ